MGVWQSADVRQGGNPVRLQAVVAVGFAVDVKGGITVEGIVALCHV